MKNLVLIFLFFLFSSSLFAADKEFPDSIVEIFQGEEDDSFFVPNIFRSSRGFKFDPRDYAVEVQVFNDVLDNFSRKTHPRYSAATLPMLFLSDGYDLTGSLGENVALQNKQAEVVSTELNVRAKSRLENLTLLDVDNRKPMPFEDNKFHTIVFLRGMCYCAKHQYEMCGGLSYLRPEEHDQFLREVGRILDKTKPDSMAILHGGFGYHKESFLFLINSLKKNLPPELRFTVVKTREGNFVGIHIYNRK